MNFGAKKVGAEAFNDASGCAVPALSPGRDRGWNVTHPLRVLQLNGVPGAGGRRELLVLKGKGVTKKPRVTQAARERG